MAEKDTVGKTLEPYSDVFADIINGFLFDGEQVVKPEDLTPADIFSQYKADKNIRSQERDVSKYWRDSCFNIIAFFGIENQSDPDKNMAMRVLSYDAAQYRKQLSDATLRRDDGLFTPVVTIVLYFGDKPWNYGTTLHDCLNIPDKHLPYVSDYRINVFDMHKMSKEDAEKFRSDFRHIVEFYAARNTGTEYMPSDTKLVHAREIADFFSVFQRDERFITAYYEATKEKEEITMCEYIDRLEAKGEARGRKEGKAEGIINTLVSLFKKGLLSLADASKEANMSEKEFEELAASMP